MISHNVIGTETRWGNGVSTCEFNAALEDRNYCEYGYICGLTTFFTYQHAVIVVSQLSKSLPYLLTNRIDAIATAVATAYPEGATRCTFIEHYPESLIDEAPNYASSEVQPGGLFSLVTFHWEELDMLMGAPSLWKASEPRHAQLPNALTAIPLLANWQKRNEKSLSDINPLFEVAN